MRLIGYLPNESSASTFSDYLCVQGISNEVEADKEGWAVWIHSEDELAKAKELLTTFLGNPAHPKYRRQASRAAEVRTKVEAESQPVERRVLDRKAVFRATMPYSVGPLTFVLICLCAAVQILRVIGYDQNVLEELYITAIQVDGNSAVFNTDLPEVRQGEFWRLFTPVLVHGNWLHLFVNMMCLFDIGSMIEARRGTGLLGLLIVVTAVFSNLGQCFLVNPYFCGMSGVVYGLLGYSWMKSRFDPASGLYLHRQTVAMMLVWFVACLIGWIPHVANAAHGVGLGLGVVWGLLSSLPAMRRGAE